MNGDEVVSDDKRNTGQPLLRILGYARESTREQAICEIFSDWGTKSSLAGALIC